MSRSYLNPVEVREIINKMKVERDNLASIHTRIENQYKEYVEKKMTGDFAKQIQINYEESIKNNKIRLQELDLIITKLEDTLNKYREASENINNSVGDSNG